MVTDWDDENEALTVSPANLDLQAMTVGQRMVNWNCNFKNSSIEIYSDWVDIYVIEEMFKVMQATKEQLPLLVNDLTSEHAQNILKQRLS